MGRGGDFVLLTKKVGGFCSGGGGGGGGGGGVVSYSRYILKCIRVTVNN